jgi:predicted AlkP superfamily pyrophosphatase or phosphodiesterase
MLGIGPVLPAVTCSVQATYLTGTWPSEHGIVGNGWYFRDTCEVRFWHQSDALVQQARVWDVAREIDPSFTCANINFWHAMYSSADITVTPRPMYPADGRKLPDVWTHPPELRDQLQATLGQFPLFKYWGPMTSIDASEWLARAAIAVDRQYDPTLTLLYLPHLDYNFQRYGPDMTKVASDLRELDAVLGTVFDHFEARGTRIIVLSEYGITPVSRPVHLNRALRSAGLLSVREELGRELLDCGASVAFAVADHQVAHVYVNDPDRIEEVRALIAGVEGVAEVLDETGKAGAHLDHERSGELVAIAAPGAWFTYYYWLDDARMPDFATTVDIHRKPGYDPAELFFNPQLPSPKRRVVWTLLKRKMGLAALLDVIGTDASLVRGSHGRAPARAEDGAMLLTNTPPAVSDVEDVLSPIAVRDVILRHLTG